MVIGKGTNGQMVIMDMVRYLVFFGILSSCLSFYKNLKGELAPNDPFVFVGENLTLTCTLTNTNLARDDQRMVFACSGRPLDSGYLQKTGKWVAQLNYPVNLSNDQNLFSCWLHNTTGILIDQQYINVDYPAAKVRNVSCIVHNWQDLNCTWALPYPYKHPDNLRIRARLSGHRYSGRGRVRASDSSLVSANWTSDGNTGYVWGYNYSLKISLHYKTQGPRGVFSQSYKLPLRTRTIVKPSPISKWSVISRNATSVSVRVRHTNNVHDKKIYLRYASQWKPATWCQKEITWLKREHVVVELSPLQPGTEYSVSIAVGPYNPDHGFLSDWRHFTVRTLPSVPLVGPEVCTGCYTVLSCNDTDSHCHVRLYWKSIPPPLRHSVLQGYRVEVTPLAHPHLGLPSSTASSSSSASSLSASSSSSAAAAAAEAAAAASLETGVTPRADGCLPDRWVDDHTTPDPSRVCLRSEGGSWVAPVVGTSSRVIVRDSGGASLVRLYAVTAQNRTSPACSSLLLPPVRSRPPVVETLVVEVNGYKAGEGWDGHFYLRWTDRGAHASFYQVVWCLGNVLTLTCAAGEGIQWLQVQEQTATFRVPDSSGRHLDPDKFLVGVSRHQPRQDGPGDVSSGIVWSSCVYLRDSAPKTVVKNVGLSPGNSKGELDVTWTFDVCPSDVTTNVFVTDFVISYCVLSSDGSTCGGAERTRTVDGEKRWATLKGLEEGRQYRVRVAPRSRWGQGPMSKALFGVAPTGVEESGSFMVAVIFVIVMVLVVVVACLVCSLCKHCQGVRRKFAENLEMNTVTEGNDTLSKTNNGHKARQDTATHTITPLTSVDLQEGGEEEEDHGDNPDFSRSSSREQDSQEVTQPLLKRKKQESTSTHGSDSGIELQHPGGDLEEVTPAVATAAAVGDRTELHDPYVKPRPETTPGCPASEEHNAGSPDSEDVLSDVSALDCSLDDEEEEEEDTTVPILSTSMPDSPPQPVLMGGGEPSGAEETAVLKVSPSLYLTRPVSRAPENVVQAMAKDSGGCVVVSTRPEALSHPQIPLSSYLAGSVSSLQDDQPAPRVTFVACDSHQEKGDPIYQAANLPALEFTSAQSPSVHDYPAVSSYVPYRQESSSCAETSLNSADRTVSSQSDDDDRPHPSLGMGASFESLEDNLDQLSCASDVSLDIQDYFTRDKGPENK